METTTWQARLALLLLCAPILHSGFITLSEAEAARQMFASTGMKAGAGAEIMALLNALAAMLVVLFEGRGRRLGAWWLAAVLLLGGLLVFPFWARSGVAWTLTLQSLLGSLGYAAAFLLVATAFRPGGAAAE